MVKEEPEDLTEISKDRQESRHDKHSPRKRSERSNAYKKDREKEGSFKKLY